MNESLADDTFHCHVKDRFLLLLLEQVLPSSSMGWASSVEEWDPSGITLSSYTNTQKYISVTLNSFCPLEVGCI